MENMLIGSGPAWGAAAWTANSGGKEGRRRHACRQPIQQTLLYRHANFLQGQQEGANHRLKTAIEEPGSRRVGLHPLQKGGRQQARWMAE